MEKIPSKTFNFFQPHDEEFIETRQKELYDFMRSVLSRPGYASHPAIISFLELDDSTSSPRFNESTN
eukprot:10950108-Ditylum_brightwellii.AAC.1